jgi:hypothetical protein
VSQFVWIKSVDGSVSFLDSAWCAESDPILFRGMEWARPQYLREVVNSAARELLEDPIFFEHHHGALAIVNNSRDSHVFPLNTFKVTLRYKAKQVYPGAIVSERRKRLSSILAKLTKEPSMKLTQMQDIGGCRAVMGSVKTVRLLQTVYEKSDLKHKLKIDDYIDEPRESGYRGIHMKYRYYSDRHDTWNGLKIELQFRSPLQHVWATAVETVGTFLGQALKSSQGEDQWLRFFALMGTQIANKERTPLVANTPTSTAELKAEIKHHVSELNVIHHLQYYSIGLRHITETNTQGARYFLLQLDASEPSLSITGYKSSEMQEALRDSQAAESGKGLDVVLISVASVTALRRAYPNYYADTDRFLELVKEAIA